MKFKFKVGDKVKILNGSNIKNYTGGWTGSMCAYVGEIATISKQVQSGVTPSYRFKEFGYRWDERGLEPLKNNETIVIYRKGNETIALDKSTGKKAVAKCSPQDKFDFYTGAKLALDRLTKNVTFRLLCVETDDFYVSNPWFKKGKVYEFVDGVTTWDTGKNSKEYSNFQHFTAFNEVWRSHFVELKEGDNPEEILKKYNNTIKKGDTVKVINKGQTYTTFVDWVERNIEYKTDRYKWDYNKTPSNGDTGRVIAIEKHNEGCKPPVLAYVEIKGRCYIIGVEGLEKC